MANSLQPSFRVVVDHFGPHTGNRNLEHQRKKRVSDQPWELTSSNVERQSKNSRSRGRGKGFMEMHDRGSHETNQATPSRANRGSTARLKSEQLKEGLAGGSAINSMKDIQKEERFSIPHDHHRAWIQKMARNEMSLDAADSDDEDGLAIENTIVLTRFRRGRIVLENKSGVSVHLDPDGKFNVFEGDRERKECGFPLNQVKDVCVRFVILLVWDFVLRLVIDEQHQGLRTNHPGSDSQWYISHSLLPYAGLMILEIPCGQQMWWKLKQPCLDIDSRFFKDIHCAIKPT